LNTQHVYTGVHWAGHTFPNVHFTPISHLQCVSERWALHATTPDQDPHTRAADAAVGQDNQKRPQGVSSACSLSSPGFGPELTFDGGPHFKETFSSLVRPGFGGWRFVRVVNRAPCGGGGVMVWAAVIYRQPTQLCFVDSDLSA